MISIIIPSLNEEKYLPLLLESIKKQNFGVPFGSYEIIVADAGSKDKTLEIAKNNNCLVVAGGLPGKARNEGAKVAKGNILFFVDSDIKLPDNFFEKVLLEFNNKKIDIASFCLKTYPENKFTDFILDFLYNRSIILLERILPHAAMGILIKKDLFEKINGFDETITLAEDMDFARRASKIGKFRIIRSVFIYSSDRRVKKDGWFKTLVKFFLCEIHMIFIGPVRNNSGIFEHKFGHYKDQK